MPVFPHRPRTKGKVERPFSSLKNQFLQGLAVQALSELEPLLAEFTEKESHRRHSVLKETPHERFQARKNVLRSLPEVEESQLFPRIIRKVSSDGYLSYQGKDYAVPFILSGTKGMD